MDVFQDDKVEIMSVFQGCAFYISLNFENKVTQFVEEKKKSIKKISTLFARTKLYKPQNSSHSPS